VQREHTGRGPTQARVVRRDEVIVCVLAEALTKAEQTLLENGGAAEVLALRRELQRAMRADFEAAVERLTGHRVVAFFSDDSLDPPLAVEMFILDAPVEDTGA
jgi:uncharacterized protein YbcI